MERDRIRIEGEWWKWDEKKEILVKIGMVRDQEHEGDKKSGEERERKGKIKDK